MNPRLSEELAKREGKAPEPPTPGPVKADEELLSHELHRAALTEIALHSQSPTREWVGLLGRCRNTFFLGGLAGRPSPATEGLIPPASPE